MSRYRDFPLECKVYVGNLGSGFVKRELQEAFDRFGPLRDVWLARSPPGFAFIHFEDPLDAEDSVRALNGTELCGRRIRVDLSKSRSGRGRRGGPPRRSRSRELSPYKRYGRHDYRSRTRSRSPRRPSRSRSPRRTVKRTPSRRQHTDSKRAPARSTREIKNQSPTERRRRSSSATSSSSRSSRSSSSSSSSSNSSCSPSKTPRRNGKASSVKNSRRRSRSSSKSSISSSSSRNSSSGSSSSSSSLSPSKTPPRNDNASPVEKSRTSKTSCHSPVGNDQNKN